METHYNNPDFVYDGAHEDEQVAVDNSGLRLYFTKQLRKFESGVMSVGRY